MRARLDALRGRYRSHKVHNVRFVHFVHAAYLHGLNGKWIPVRAYRDHFAIIRHKICCSAQEEVHVKQLLIIRCVACRKDFGPSEVVYRTSVNYETGKPLDWPTGAYRGWRTPYISTVQAPVCEDCRPQGDHFKWSDPVPCAACGRPLRCAFKRQGKGARTCSHTCWRRLNAERQRQKRGSKDRTRLCVICQSPFVPTRSDAATCSQKCRQKAYRERARVTDKHRLHPKKDINDVYP